MKSEIFNQYATKVAALFKIPKEDLFIKTKKRENVDARFLLYYLCAKRPMRVKEIEKYMTDNGYELQHSSVVRGISVIEKRVEEDDDYIRIIKEIEKSVFIL